MTTTITEEADVDLSLYRSKRDGWLVLEVDTSMAEHEGIRIHLNDGLLYSGRPTEDGSAIGVLEEIRALIARRTDSPYSAADAPTTVDLIKDLVDSILSEP